MFGSCENALKEGYQIRDDGFKHCRYCGSMDPVELAQLITDGKASMSGSDWKYGWPHKFYVEIDNPNKEDIVQIGSTSEWDEEKNIRTETPIMGRAGNFHSKFYSNHLGLLDEETFNKVVPIINEACGVKFEMKKEGLYYSAPYHNYQKC